MARAILNEDNVRLPLLIHCVCSALRRLDPQEVVEAFISAGWNYKARHSGASYIPRRRYLSVLDDLEVTQNERVLVNQIALKIREQGRGAAQRAGREGAQVIADAVHNYVKQENERRKADIEAERAGIAPHQELVVTLPLDIVKTLLGDNVNLLRDMVDDKRLTDQQFRGLAGIVLSEFEMVD